MTTMLTCRGCPDLGCYGLCQVDRVLGYDISCATDGGIVSGELARVARRIEYREWYDAEGARHRNRVRVTDLEIGGKTVILRSQDKFELRYGALAAA